MDSAEKLELSDYKQWKKENSNSYFSLFDYLSVQSKKHSLPIDTWVAFCELFVPKLIEKDGHIFVEECFKEKQDDYCRYLKDGRSKEEVEVWINSVCLDGFFYDLPGETDEVSNFIGKKLQFCWEMKLKEDFPNRKFTVALEKDDDVSDFFLTFYEVK